MTSRRVRQLGAVSGASVALVLGLGTVATAATAVSGPGVPGPGPVLPTSVVPALPVPSVPPLPIPTSPLPSVPIPTGTPTVPITVPAPISQLLPGGPGAPGSPGAPQAPVGKSGAGLGGGSYGQPAAAKAPAKKSTAAAPKSTSRSGSGVTVAQLPGSLLLPGTAYAGAFSNVPVLADLSAGFGVVPPPDLAALLAGAGSGSPDVPNAQVAAAPSTATPGRTLATAADQVPAALGGGQLPNILVGLAVVLIALVGAGNARVIGALRR
jgi:hypothetical protein